MPSKRKTAANAGVRIKPRRTRPPMIVGALAGPVKDFEVLLGTGTDLWADDAEFEAFLADLRRWRQQDRENSKRP